MGNVCSFNSPDLVKYVAVAAAGGLLSQIPTFAVSPDNADILSVQGSITVATTVAGGGNPGDVCTFSSTDAYTPYITGPAGRTNCNVLSGSTAYNTLSCPSVTLTALPTGPYQLAFDSPGNLPVYNSIQPNTFTIGLPPSTTTLAPAPAITSTETVTTGTSTVTITESPAFATTSTLTIVDSTQTKTVFTNTVTQTTIVIAKTFGNGLSTSTQYTGTTTKTSTKTLTSTTCSASSTPLSCPASANTRYTASSGDVYQIECFDRPGHDLTCKKNVQDMKACIAACSSTSGCKGVAYQAASNLCYLKKKEGASQKKSGIIGARLISNYKRGIAIATRSGGHPDFTYPPNPTTVTVTPEPSGTSTITVSVGASTTTTSTPDPSGTATVTQNIQTTTTETDVNSTSTQTITSTSSTSLAVTTVYRQKTAYTTVTKTVTVTQKACSPRGYGYS